MTWTARKSAPAARQNPVAPRTAEIRVALAAFAVFCTGLLGFTEVFRGAAWWVDSAIIGLAVFTVAVTLRAVLWRARSTMGAVLRSLAVWLATAVAYLVVLTWMFAPDSTAVVVVPTADTMATFDALRLSGVHEIYTGRSPLLPSDGLLFLVTAVSGGIALLMAVLVFTARSPILAGLVAFAVYLAPMVAVTPVFQPVSFALFAVALLILIREEVRRRNARTVTGTPSTGRRLVVPAAVAVVAVAAAVASPSIFPQVTQRSADNSNLGPSPFAAGVNPLIVLGNNLKRPLPTTVLSYTTDAKRPLYLKVLNIDDLSQAVWGPSDFTVDVNNSIAEFPSPTGLGLAVPTEEFTTTVTVDNLYTAWLPLPYPTTTVSGLSGSWTWEPTGLTVNSADSTTHSQEYVATSLAVTPSLEQLRAAPRSTDEQSAQRFLQLPPELPDVIVTTATEITAAASTDYDRAIALQRYFRDQFTYSETAPVANGFDGSQGEAIASFLERKSGYCVHFSSAMTVMARSLGIPARIALGYLPGTATTDTPTGQPGFEVTSDQLHAWPELYFEGIGWIPFEPTTSRGVATAFAASPTGQSATGPIPQDTTVRQTATGAPTSTPTDRADSGSSAITTARGVSATPFLVSAGIVLVLLLPLLVRSAGTVWRRRAGIRTNRPAGLAWSEFLATAADLGVPAADTESPRAFAARLRDRLDGDCDAIAALVSAVERESYGNPRGADDGTEHTGLANHAAEASAAALRAATAELRAGFSPGQRAAARLFPRSLIRRRTAAALG